MLLVTMVNPEVYVFFGKKSVSVEVTYSESHSYVLNKNTNLSFHYSFMYGIPIRKHRNLGRNLEDYTLIQACHGYVLVTLMNFFINKINVGIGTIVKSKFNSSKTPSQIRIWRSFHKRETNSLGVTIGKAEPFRKKLDRCVVNWEWRKRFPNAIVTLLAPISSNHSPLIIEEAPVCSFKERTFRLGPYRTEHEDFKATIEQTWKREDGNIMSKLTVVKSSLDNWSKNTFKRADFKIKKLISKICTTSPFTSEYMKKRFKIKK